MQTKAQAKAAEADRASRHALSDPQHLAVQTYEAEDNGLMDMLGTPSGLRCERILNHEAFLLPQVAAALHKWRPATDVAAWVELVQQVVEDESAVWAVGAGSRIYGMLIISRPFNDLWPWPYVGHLQIDQDSPRNAKQLLVEAGVAWMKEQGYDRFWSMNVAGLSDEVWERVFRNAGTPIRRGSVYEVQL